MSKGARDAADAQARACFARCVGGFCGGHIETGREVFSAAVRQVREDALPCVRRAALDACLTLAAGLPKTLEDDDESHTFSREEFLHLLLASLIPIALQLATAASAEGRATSRGGRARCATSIREKQRLVVADEARALLEDDDSALRSAACEAIPGSRS